MDKDNQADFFKTIIDNTNPLSAFISFQIITARTYSDYEGGTYVDAVVDTDQFLEEDDGEAIGPPFYSIYGLYRTETKDGRQRKWIADCANKDEAISLVEDLTGLKMVLVEDVAGLKVAFVRDSTGTQTKNGFSNG